MHSPPAQASGMNRHSFKSIPVSSLPGPSGHNLLNSSGRDEREYWNRDRRYIRSIKDIYIYIFLITAILRRTLLAIFAPCLAHGAATVFLRHSARPREGASAPQVAHVSVVTQILPDVDAPHRIRLVAQSVSDRTLADHSTLRVDAPPILADFLGRHAFVHV